ncbi:MAG TPA: hypothetical protein ENI62_06115 [Gammaproteobacteria bacterium]|nr:hypothetical protein [Gammaproteobacteria bacterium]
MSVLTTRRHYSRNILLQLLSVAVIVVILLLWQRHFLSQLYLKNQLTMVGWVINGFILLLFLGGMGRLVQLLLRYHREEDELNRFVGNVQRVVEPIQGLNPDAVIANRYRTLLELHARRAPINHNVLAATLVASESSRQSFPRFVNNILILTGVFGTIVSLSIALLGASDLVQSTSNTGDLSVIIHGMSTALSTTMTAIVCYVFFSYYFQKLMDVQTYLISRVENVTTILLLPRFQAQTESVMKDFSDLLRGATALLQRVDTTQQVFTQTATHLAQLAQNLDQQYDLQAERIDGISEILRQGFRLHEDQQ